MKTKNPTYEIVRELFDYHEDGYLIWKMNRGSRAKKGDVPGSLGKRGYLEIRFDGKLHKLHRIIFLWHHGYLPELVDHDDRIKTHNWIDNLSDASKQCNARNAKKLCTNTSGVTGVRFVESKSKWISRIMINGKTIHLGCYDNFDDAVKARYKKEVEVHWNGCNSTSCAFLYLKEKTLLPKRRILRRIVK